MISGFQSTRCRYYLNALFDLELGGFPPESVRRSAAEMTALFIPLSRPGDTIVLDVEPPDAWYSYLREAGLGPGTALPLRNRTDEQPSVDVVWGWNREAMARLALVNEHPPLNAVREINNRLFCSTLASRFGSGVPGSRFCSTMEEAESAAEELEGGFPLVIKPAFGGAGFGLRIVRQPGRFAAERALIARYLNHGGVVIEPWLPRSADLSAALQIGLDGNPGLIRYQRQMVNAYGSFYAVYCAETDPVIEPWKNELERNALVIAREAAARGYVGPVGIDSFVYGDIYGRDKLAAGIEINGRFTMGMLAQMLRERIAPEKHTLLRFFSRKKCRLPETYPLLEATLGRKSFISKAGYGILLLTPLRVGYQGKWAQPHLNAFFLSGESERRIHEFDRELQRLFSR